VAEWRGLLRALKDPEIAEKFPPDKRFVAAAVGTVERTWRAWEPHLGKTVQGHPVTNPDVLEAVKTWSGEKLRRAKAGETLAGPMLPTLLNGADFVDAVIRSVKTRLAAQEVPDAS